MEILKIGDVVTATLFGGHKIIGKIEKIEITSADSKYGKDVQKCDLSKHANGVVDLDNGHWCYFNQIKSKLL